MSRVRVCCRVRPTLGDGGDVDDCISVTGKDGGGATDVNVLVSGGASFQIDAAYGQHATQEELFDGVARPLIDEAFGGINCTLFSYGQTGSGKTFTLQGKSGPLRGILPRAVECIFQQMTALSQGGSDDQGQSQSPGQTSTTCELHISVMEIYKERLRDLLVSVGPASLTSSWGQGSAGGSTAANLRIRQHADGSVWVEGLTETRVASEAQFSEMLAGALKKRATGSHAMNSESSRSHLVTILSLRQHRHASGQRVCSKIHLIDLAGSEMVRKTDATGNALKEAMHINKSLSALGNVIYALTSPAAGSGAGGSGGGDAREKKAHVPYRDSKLTRLLQDSLGGNAKTVLLLAVASARAHMQESVNTLRFGERARQVCTHPRVNAELDDDRVRGALQRAEAQILLLSQTIAAMQLQAAGSEESGGGGGGGGDGMGSLAPSVCVACAARRVLEEERPAAAADAAAAVGLADKSTPAAKLVKAVVPAVTGKPTPSGSSSSSSTSAAAKRGASGKQKPGPTRAPVTKAGSAAAAKEAAVHPPSSVPVLPQLLSPRPPALPPSEEEALSASGPTSAPDPTSTSALAIAPAPFVDASGPAPAPDVSAAEQQLLDAVRRSAATAPGDDDDDDDLCGRCAVCGLDEDGSARLQDQTGEVLGALFMCDGNCGGTFHARCVNLVGDGGQFQEPEGEWYCSSCTVEEGVAAGARGAASQATLEYLRAEYHAMRRERNRVLTQWQQERNIADIIDARHRTTNQQRDREGVQAAERVAALEAELAAERHESGRLRAVSEELLAALQQGSSALGPQSPRRGLALAPLGAGFGANTPGPGNTQSTPAVSSWQMMLQAESSMLRRSKSGDGEDIPVEAETPPCAATSPPQQRRPWAQRADIEAASSPLPIPLMSLSPQGFSASLLLDAADDSRPDDDPGSSPPSSSSSSSTSKIKSRLKELLRAVQEEAVSFNQITKRHKEREVLRGSRSGSLQT